MKHIKLTHLIMAGCALFTTEALAVKNDVNWIKQGSNSGPEYDARGYIGKGDYIMVVVVPKDGRTRVAFKVKLNKTSLQALKDEIRTAIAHIPEVSKFVKETHFNLNNFILEEDNLKVDKPVSTDADVKAIKPGSKWGIVDPQWGK